jgi:transposase-like protein
VFDDQAQEVHIGVQARSGAVDGEFREAVVARQLGVRRNQLCKWNEQLGHRGAKAFGGPGRRSEANSGYLSLTLILTPSQLDTGGSEKRLITSLSVL